MSGTATVNKDKHTAGQTALRGRKQADRTTQRVRRHVRRSHCQQRQTHSGSDGMSVTATVNKHKHTAGQTALRGRKQADRTTQRVRRPSGVGNRPTVPDSGSDGMSGAATVNKDKHTAGQTACRAQPLSTKTTTQRVRRPSGVGNRLTVPHSGSDGMSGAATVNKDKHTAGQTACQAQPLSTKTNTQRVSRHVRRSHCQQTQTHSGSAGMSGAATVNKHKHTAGQPACQAQPLSTKTNTQRVRRHVSHSHCQQRQTHSGSDGMSVTATVNKDNTHSGSDGMSVNKDQPLSTQTNTQRVRRHVSHSHCQQRQTHSGSDGMSVTATVNKDKHTAGQTACQAQPLSTKTNTQRVSRHVSHNHCQQRQTHSGSAGMSGAATVNKDKHTAGQPACQAQPLSTKTNTQRVSRHVRRSHCQQRQTHSGSDGMSVTATINKDKHTAGQTARQAQPLSTNTNTQRVRRHVRRSHCQQRQTHSGSDGMSVTATVNKDKHTAGQTACQSQPLSTKTNTQRVRRHVRRSHCQQTQTHSGSDGMSGAATVNKHKHTAGQTACQSQPLSTKTNTQQVRRHVSHSHCQQTQTPQLN